MVTVKILVDTVLKLSAKQAFELPPQEKLSVRAGNTYKVHSFEVEGDHVRIAFDDVFFGPQNRNTWFVYAPHVEFDGTWPENNPKDNAAAPPEDRGKILKLPGYGSVGLNDLIVPGGHFRWSEATKDGSRIPADKSVVDGIIRVAKAMEEVRAYLGDRAISVNSWYRDPGTNRRVGGARDSHHMRGDAVDFTVQGLSPSEVQARLDSWWGGRGGLASASSFTHIDTRGVKARWRYGF